MKVRGDESRFVLAGLGNGSTLFNALFDIDAFGAR
jgi:hypothetical protein